MLQKAGFVIEQRHISSLWLCLGVDSRDHSVEKDVELQGSDAMTEPFERFVPADHDWIREHLVGLGLLAEASV
ncbi:MAG: hypothetical protein U9N87_07280 [Planctomycetota bacterium]|nr:hypothetical protein [Planctomycetota bacterium]